MAESPIHRWSRLDLAQMRRLCLWKKSRGEGCVLPPPARARKLEIGHGDEGSRAMSGQGDGRSGGGKSDSGKSGDGTREERLKAALRENLRRRKAQVRGREAAEPAPVTPAETTPVDRTDGDER
ncbi:hypothetical protein [Methylobacterium aquaticum]|uniref:hypothetical protein n=1 Tax=Methylobacterium aquaticum TaxID=270351 RepID=UPI00193424C5|nr:hypothetical protein F1D61_18825 [Methylobacterium aquaticum]